MAEISASFHCRATDCTASAGRAKRPTNAIARSRRSLKDVMDTPSRGNRCRYAGVHPKNVARSRCVILPNPGILVMVEIGPSPPFSNETAHAFNEETLQVVAGTGQSFGKSGHLMVEVGVRRSVDGQ